MPRIKPPPNLPQLVKTAFNKARESGDLIYYPTEVTLLNVNSIPFQLRFSPSLANKPKAPPPSSTPGKKQPFNPFANPSASLLISPLPPSHNLVLNKFAVVPEHFILSTKEFAKQTDLLGEQDLEAAHACIRAYAGEGRELFVFFNSGEHSGASQPHRHLQMLDVGNMREGLPEENGWEVLADGLAGGERQGRKVPFWTAGRRVEEGWSGRELWRCYLELYRRACRKMGVEVEGQSDGEARISYNLAMTRGAMVICPRVSEGGSVRGEGGEEVGWLALNGTVLAGTALVKSRREWDALRRDPSQVAEVLERIGVTAVEEAERSDEEDVSG
ncbi:ATP adenylyltransferase [Coniochaeta hoffmannii]|uniref:ATP adenylyltransferase n=1 Tax=Coniochaeta hoffmannii TaxID=91930 RepID=A0AA38VHP3_9PEZI|nr:ATP adenylyltransferase [Coniochaeta hoffmannii]